MARLVSSLLVSFRLVSCRLVFFRIDFSGLVIYVFVFSHFEATKRIVDDIGRGFITRK